MNETDNPQRKLNKAKMLAAALGTTLEFTLQFTYLSPKAYASILSGSMTDHQLLDSGTDNWIESGSTYDTSIWRLQNRGTLTNFGTLNDKPCTITAS